MSDYPIFGIHNSRIERSNDGRLQIQPRNDALGFAVLDTTDRHVEFFTVDRLVAEALVAGYDYRAHADTDDGGLDAETVRDLAHKEYEIAKLLGPDDTPSQAWLDFTESLYRLCDSYLATVKV